ncbi:MAG: peptidoglycan -binding protein [Rhodocyclaceae bacterium]|jgi:chemotaxis protein MotB|nr:peptidoglycan -binding protein [Rhodocyclaceae bacterium]
MAVLSRRRRGPDFWPGFVDALASLLMVMVFVILIFVIGQFVLTDAVSGRDRALARLNAELAALAQTLSLESAARERAEAHIGELSATLASERDAQAALAATLEETRGTLSTTERALLEQREESVRQREQAARLVADIAALERLKRELESEVARLASELDTSERTLKDQVAVSESALAQIELLNRQLAAIRTQLEELNKALAAAEATIQARDLKIDELGRELNLALAARVQELTRFRSEFFGRLRAVLGERTDIQVVGDRFVFSSEVLFPSASDEVSEEGLKQLLRLAETLKTIAKEIPEDLPWVLQVDGHTDRRPIATARFPSNWELSTARALAIVKFLRDQGVPAQRLAATGYGEYHPLQAGDSTEAHARNRRIELKITSR